MTNNQEPQPPLPTSSEAQAALSSERLAEIKAREQATTCGPWKAWFPDTGRSKVAVVDDETLSPQGRMLCHCSEDTLKHFEGCCSCNLPICTIDRWDSGPREERARAEFIAHARQDVPELLSEIERQRKELEAVRASLETMPQNFNIRLYTLGGKELLHGDVRFNYGWGWPEDEGFVPPKLEIQTYVEDAE